ncbi:alpha/beta fold hydrolase [Desertihabitans aurantiacus]|uniref:alpha/beta fold hydrolase n=1 Tax=Desertihabitans aurantiacus TaxID=2282477 RepID=UPI000DF86135|nr:alpha/beta hydrolase [Desertihabitans aurantiacus]
MSSDLSSTPILFLGGAGLPAWIWDEVRADLPAESVVATYPKRADTRLDDCVSSVLVQAPEGPFTVVAHSLGGVVATQLAATAPERVAGLLGVSASFPAVGASFLGASALQRVVLGAVMRVAGTRPPERAIRSVLCAGLGENDIQRIVSEFEPESPRLYRDRMSRRAFPGWTGYVVTTADPMFRATTQHRHAAELGPGFRRELPTGHLPMLQDPSALVSIIQEFTTGACAPAP